MDPGGSQHLQGVSPGGTDTSQRPPSRQDGGKEKAADVHPVPLPTTPADPTAKKPQILGNFSTPKEKAGFLPTHTSKLYILSLKHLVAIKVASLPKKTINGRDCFCMVYKERIPVCI